VSTTHDNDGGKEKEKETEEEEITATIPNDVLIRLGRTLIQYWTVMLPKHLGSVGCHK
jgi:hypothetical protein